MCDSFFFTLFFFQNADDVSLGHPECFVDSLFERGWIGRVDLAHEDIRPWRRDLGYGLQLVKLGARDELYLFLRSIARNLAGAPEQVELILRQGQQMRLDQGGQLRLKVLLAFYPVAGIQLIHVDVVGVFHLERNWVHRLPSVQEQTAFVQK